MHLELYDDARNKVADLTDNSKPLQFYSPLDGLVILINFFFSPLFMHFNDPLIGTQLDVF